ncbi:MAG: hypothetical protein MJ211_04155 [Bacteroidales bacterium]|nr:hypothetical protein [Bacteroidales bacterium]
MLEIIYLGTVLKIRNISGVVVSYAEIDHISNNSLNKVYEFRLVDNIGKEYFLIVFRYSIYLGNEFDYNSNMMLVEPYHQIKCYDSVHLDWGKEIIKKKIGYSNYADNQRFDFNYYYDKKTKNVYVERDLEEKIHIRLFGTFVKYNDIIIEQCLSKFPIISNTYIEGEPIKRQSVSPRFGNDVGEILIDGNSYNVLKYNNLAETNFLGFINHKKNWRQYVLQNSNSGEICNLTISNDKQILWHSITNQNINLKNLKKINSKGAVDINTKRKEFSFKEYQMRNNKDFIKIEKHNNNQLKFFEGDDISDNKIIAYKGFNEKKMINNVLENQYIMNTDDLFICSVNTLLHAPTINNNKNNISSKNLKTLNNFKKIDKRFEIFFIGLLIFFIFCIILAIFF